MAINFVNPWPQFFSVSDIAGHYIYFGQPNQDPVANPKNVFNLDGVSQGFVVQLNSRGAPDVPLQLINPPYSMIIYTDLVGNGGAAVPNTEVPEFNGSFDDSASPSEIWESVEDAVKLDNVARINPAANVAAILLNNSQFRVGDETENVEFFQVEGLDTFVNASLIRKNKNKLINAQGRFNQRSVSGSVVLASGIYGHDRWRGGSGAGTYTFATALGITTFTITAGTIQQVIAGENLHSGAVVLSWVGDAEARINGGAYGPSPITGTAVGGTDMTIEFQQNGTDDFSLPQLEYGPNASDFDYIDFDAEELRCKYYFNRIINDESSNIGLAYGFVTNAVADEWRAQMPSFPPMRVDPAVTTSGVFDIIFRQTVKTIGSPATFTMRKEGWGEVTGDTTTAMVQGDGMTLRTNTNAIIDLDSEI